METKVCKCCKKEKEITQNYTLSNRYYYNKDGAKCVYSMYLTECKDCKKIKSRENYKKIKELKQQDKSDTKVLDTMIKIYQEKGLNDILEAFKVIGKKELKELAYKQLNI